MVPEAFCERNQVTDSSNKCRMYPLAGLLLFVSLMTVPSAHALGTSEEKRLDEVAERGTHVMPFDLEKTLHVFSKSASGGIQQVIVKNGSNVEQVQLIRDHLMEISEAFKQRDFSNPESMHREDMPGLTELRAAGSNQITIEYMALPDGTQIKYSSKLSRLVSAIHQWFDAQLNDHARHAVPGHQHTHY
ncbi:hypothetical protein SAMN05216302_101526 [Nitrosomonas aestuarii]|uniref:Aspartate carbamoyltransferase n=1 Tax=Nitrosomonas aestuarii TaxID=52441 RepID=A0A1I4CAH0_9PROT|nr:hypothetical protein SAMN05216302_101526 [Nitrosomonas aestuarii]